MLQADVQTTPAAPPAPAAPPVIVDGQLRTLDAAPGAHELLMAMQAQRDELREQLQQLEGKREEITEQIRENRSQGMDISGLEQRVKEIDGRISAIDQQIAMADAAVAKAAAVPGAVVAPLPDPFVAHQGPPDGAFVMGGLFIVFVLMPIALAFSRRLWRRGAATTPALPADVNDRLRAIEHAVESVAVEVERIGEGQRFMSRVFTERGGPNAEPRALGEGAAPVIDVAQRQKVAEQR